MLVLTRKHFLLSLLVVLVPGSRKRMPVVMTVNGPVDTRRLGTCLVHEHVLVDFIGAAEISYSRWNREAVIKKVLPFLTAAKAAGVRSFFDCTPAFLGRDVVLLQQLSRNTGMHFITNTGYYGAVKNKYLPSFAFTETAEALASRWINEYRNGIEGSGIKPGFIKTAVDADEPLSELHQKLVRAAALTHLETGLTIYSHTGAAKAAFQQLHLLREMGVHPSAFVWVHAQAETNKAYHLQAAKMSCWVSLDGIGWGGIDDYADSLSRLKSARLLHKVLISHDAGWYKPGEPDAEFKGYTNIFTSLIPALEKKGFTRKDIDLLLVKNPASALEVRVKKI